MSALASTNPNERARGGIAAWPPLLRILTLATTVAVAFGLYLGLFYAGTDIDQGQVQRIFYIHLSAFTGAFIAFCGTVLGGIQYLRTRNVQWDSIALAGAEIGLALSILNLVTGMIWARPIWNTWWNWDPRLTSAAIMLLTYAAYLMLRAGIDNPEQRRRFASVYGVFAIATVILTLIIPRIVPSSIHPIVIGPVFNGTQAFVEGAFELAATPGVAVALLVNMAVWTLLVPVVLMWHRVRLENDAQRIHARKAALLEREA